MFTICWNSNEQCFEAEIKGKTLTVYPELIGYADRRASLKFNYDHVDYTWQYLDGYVRITVGGSTRRKPVDFPAVPRYLIPDLDYYERDQVSDVLVAALHKSRCKYTCTLAGSICRKEPE